MNIALAPEQSTNESYDNQLIRTFCSAVCDTVYCWPETPAGMTITKHCSDLFRNLHPDLAVHLDGHATRECQTNGTWVQGRSTIYFECTNSVRSYLKNIEEDEFLVSLAHYILFIGSILSLVCLGISLSIFYNFRCLQCDRVTVHILLMFSLVMRFVLVLIITEPEIISHSSTFRDVGILCESILVLFLFSTFASVSWMLIQGIFLNMSLMVGVISVSMNVQLTIYYIIGWGVPAAFILLYVISMLSKEQESCWNGYSDMTEMWILHGPIVFEVIVTGLLLLNILRVLVNKVRNSATRRETSKIKAAAKATAILFPVLGINNLVLFYNPGGFFNKYFVILNTFFASTQGILVSIVYCFTNKDVCAAILRSAQRRSIRRAGNFDPSENNLILGVPLTNFLSRRRTLVVSTDVGLGQAV